MNSPKSAVTRTYNRIPMKRLFQSIDMLAMTTYQRLFFKNSVTLDMPHDLEM